MFATREPGGSPGAEAVRRLLLEGEADRWDAVSEALLLCAARRDHIRKLIEPALRAGTWIICDRFTDSTFAYQGYGRGAPLSELAAIQHAAIADFRPDLTLMLDLPVSDGLSRAAARRGAGDRFERLDRAFHERLRQGFLAIAAAEPVRCAVIDAFGTVEEVHAAIVATVARRLGIALA